MTEKNPNQSLLALLKEQRAFLGSLRGVLQQLTDKIDVLGSHGRSDKLRYPLKEAARILRVHINTLQKRIREGRLKATLEGNKYFVHRDEIERYAQGQGELKTTRHLRDRRTK
jgi:excisionase family DNA binding protein